MRNSDARSARLRVLLLAIVVFAAMAAFLWWRTRQTRLGNDGGVSPNAGTGAGSVVEKPTPAATPTVSPGGISGPTELPAPSEPPADAGGSDKTATPTDNSQPTNAAPSESFIGTLKLIIPVVGVRPDQLTDTFADARSEARVHDAIDIPAPAGTAVMAAADGEVIKLFQSERGGTTIYQLSTDKKFVFYYAHLQRYADGLAVGKFVRQGETIAYVGDTGNAGAGNFHLHFSIAVINDPKRYWEGANINPYPLLRK